jgi:hypothetical protein
VSRLREESPRQRTPLLGLPEPTSPEQAIRTGRTPRVMTTTTPGSGWVPALAHEALSRLIAQRHAVSTQRPVSDTDWAVRADRLAVLCEREACWLDVLGRWVWRQQDTVPVVLGRAAFDAAEFRRQRAAFWREIATDWRRRAAGQPVCDVLGCGCGGTCGVSA